jgi:hypothetical protein
MTEEQSIIFTHANFEHYYFTRNTYFYTDIDDMKRVGKQIIEKGIPLYFVNDGPIELADGFLNSTIHTKIDEELRLYKIQSVR